MLPEYGIREDREGARHVQNPVPGAMRRNGSRCGGDSHVAAELRGSASQCGGNKQRWDSVSKPFRVKARRRNGGVVQDGSTRRYWNQDRPEITLAPIPKYAVEILVRVQAPPIGRAQPLATTLSFLALWGVSGRLLNGSTGGG